MRIITNLKHHQTASLPALSFADSVAVVAVTVRRQTPGTAPLPRMDENSRYHTQSCNKQQHANKNIKSFSSYSGLAAESRKKKLGCPMRTRQTLMAMAYAGQLHMKTKSRKKTQCCPKNRFKVQQNCTSPAGKACQHKKETSPCAPKPQPGEQTPRSTQDDSHKE